MSSSITSTSTAPEWSLIQTITPAAAATVDFTGLTVYDEYRVVAKLFCVGNSMRMTLNNSGAGYQWRQTINNAVGNSAAQADFYLFYSNGNVNQYFEVLIRGLTPTVANGLVAVSMSVPTAASNTSVQMIFGQWDGGSATQINRVTLTAETSCTGVVKIYGKNVT